MQRYENLAGDSPVSAYEIGGNSITIEFNDDHAYLYNYERTGAEHIEEMKKLAAIGRGLATYINKYVKQKYAAKLR